MLASIAAPTLIVVGEHDAITPVSMAEIMLRIPRSTLKQISGAGHMTPMETPEQVNAAIREFVSHL
jgi:pimeloyl-ACP methyl ester carboxylesterase